MIKPYLQFLRKFLFVTDMLIVTLMLPFSFGIHNKLGHMLQTGILYYIFNEINWNLFEYSPLLLILIPLWYLALYHYKAYDSFRTKEFSDTFFTIIHSAVVISIAYSCIFWINSLNVLPKQYFENAKYSIVLIYPAICAFAMSVSRFFLMGIFRFIRRLGYNKRNIIIVGTGKRAVEHFKKIQHHAEWGINLLGFITLFKDDDIPKEFLAFPNLGFLSEIENILNDNNTDEIFFIVPRKSLDSIGQAVVKCDLLGITVHIAIDLYDMQVSKPTTSYFYGMPVLTFSSTNVEYSAMVIKRLIDIIVSLFGIIIFLPFGIIIGILIKLESKGPIFFSQERCGMHGRKFHMLKFRSMVHNAEILKEKLKQSNEVSGPIFKIKTDPRVTKVGKLLRKSSLDEVPQLLNVFIGHMSLVGPRPPLPSEVKQYKPWQRRKLSMRPGITCIWQVSGRNNIPFEKWMELDLEYIDNWSLTLDFILLLKTIPSVLTAKGNY